MDLLQQGHCVTISQIKIFRMNLLIINGSRTAAHCEQSQTIKINVRVNDKSSRKCQEHTDLLLILVNINICSYNV